MPWLDLLPDNRLDPSVVFASILDEGLDGSIEVVGHFTTVEGGVSHPAYVDCWRRLPEGADIVDYRGHGDAIWDKIKSGWVRFTHGRCPRCEGQLGCPK